jgi:PhnB protein
LIVHDAAAAIDFYKKAFGAEELFRIAHPGGKKLIHAEVKIGDSPVMLADEMPETGFKGPQGYGGTPVSTLLYVDDVDKCFKQALDAGATELRPVADQFYGDRLGTLSDPFGHVWSLATHVEDVDPAEMDRRFREATKNRE